MKMIKADPIQAQQVQALVTRKKGESSEFWAKAITGREGFFAVVGNIPDGSALLTIGTAEGNMLIDPSGLSCTVVLSEDEVETINEQGMNALLISGLATVTMNTNPEKGVLHGSLWLEPAEEWTCAPAPGRALTKGEVEKALEAGKQRRADFVRTRGAAVARDTVQTEAPKAPEKTGAPGFSAS